MKKILSILIVCLLTSLSVFAQGPKWVLKAKKAVFSVITFDKDNNILNQGNGFFITENGVAVSQYNLFKGAHRAVVIDTDGKELAVRSILGADDTYNVLKFQVDLPSSKKVQNLELSSDSLSVGSEVLVLPYSVSKDRACRPGVIRSVEKIRGGYKYYSLDLRSSEVLASCPMVTTSGQVLGLLELSDGRSKSDVLCHAIDANFINNLSLNALSFNDVSLNAIKIRKGLPNDMGQALTYLLMTKTRLPNQEYALLLDDYQKMFPTSYEGYFNKALYYLEKETVSADDLKMAQRQINLLLELKDTTSDAYFSIAKIIIMGHYTDAAKDNKSWALSAAHDYLDKAIAMSDLALYTQVKGELYVDEEEWDKALVCYEKLNKTELASPHTYLISAQIQEKKGVEMSVVLATLDSCVQLLSKPYDLNSAIYLFERGRVNAEVGNFRNAMFDLNDYHYAVNGQVNDQFYYYREQVAIKARMYQQAIDDIASAIKLNPEELSYYSENAAVHLKVGRYEEALKIVDQLLAKDENFAEAYRLQGIAFLQLKDKSACTSFKKAVELGDPIAAELLKKSCN